MNTITTEVPMATKDQKKAIRRNSQYKVDIKEEWVQWATESVDKTSLNDLTFEQANKILIQQGGQPFKSTEDNWGIFDKNNTTHKIMLSVLYQADWTIPSHKHGYIPDTVRLSDFLKSKKSPINKPLKNMTDAEVEKIIVALKGVVKYKYKKK